MTRRVTSTRRSAARDMTKALLHQAADAPQGRHRSTAVTAVPARTREKVTPHTRVRPTMPKM